MSLLLVVGFFALLVSSALLSAAETAAFSIGESRLRTLSAEGFHGADALRTLRTQRPALRETLRLLESLLNLGALACVGAWGWGVGNRVSTVALLLAMLTVFLCAEVLPRAVAARWPIRIALRGAPILLPIERWVRVALSPALRIERLVAGEEGEDGETTGEREVREMTELGREEGIVGADEHMLVERAFGLDELVAWDVMVPRVDIVAWKSSLRLGDILDELLELPYSRVPIYGDSIDDITGVLYVREAYVACIAGNKDVLLSELAREAFFVPGSRSLAQLLRDFQTRRIHMGIVADEFGGTDGLVTLEDVLEELVGDIVDETDVAEESIVMISDDELEADGGVDLREVNEAFNAELPQVEHRSLNGFILEEMGYVPKRGESIEREGIQIDILEATDTQVLRARLRKLSTREDGNGR